MGLPINGNQGSSQQQYLVGFSGGYWVSIHANKHLIVNLHDWDVAGNEP